MHAEARSVHLRLAEKADSEDHSQRSFLYDA